MVDEVGNGRGQKEVREEGGVEPVAGVRGVVVGGGEWRAPDTDLSGGQFSERVKVPFSLSSPPRQP